MNRVENPNAVKKASAKTGMAQKLLEDNRLVAAYIRGEVSIEEVKAKGIKFVKAL